MMGDYSKFKIYSRVVVKCIFLVGPILCMSLAFWQASELWNSDSNATEDQKVLTKTISMDNSSTGIRLPNATVCIELDQKLTLSKEMDVIFAVQDVDYTISSMYNGDTLMYSTFSTYIQNPQMKKYNADTLNKMNTSSAIKDHLVKLCYGFNIVLLLNSDNNYSIPFDFCEAALNGEVSFSINLPNLFCFQLPLNQFVFYSNSVEFFPPGRSVKNERMARGRSNNLKQSINLVITNRLGWPLLENFVKNVVLYVPEHPIIYAAPSTNGVKKFGPVSVDHLTQTLSSIDFRHFYNVRVEISIDGKYANSSEKNCTDVYDGLKCRLKCEEDDFFQQENCTRISFRNFLVDETRPICSIHNYRRYFDEGQKTFLFDFRRVEECYRGCSKCSTLKFRYEVQKSVVDNRPLPFDLLDPFCGIYKLVLNGTQVEDCENEIQEIPKKNLDKISFIYQIWSKTWFKTELNKNGTPSTQFDFYFCKIVERLYTGNCTISIKKDGRTNVINRIKRIFYYFQRIVDVGREVEFKNLLSGNIVYEFSVKSFQYPEFVVEPTNTKIEEEIDSLRHRLAFLFLGIGLVALVAFLYQLSKFIISIVKKRQEDHFRVLIKRLDNETNSMAESFNFVVPVNDDKNGKASNQNEEDKISLKTFQQKQFDTPMKTF